MVRYLLWLTATHAQQETIIDISLLVVRFSLVFVAGIIMASCRQDVDIGASSVATKAKKSIARIFCRGVGNSFI